ncbi:hypothetical protein B0A48_15254 [Cryoendolithus antarcticus]|uniref:HNH domain-containing protein n=1 Tax=Cryoendolithus antarcticus TaxID=1507870 RepID=A0A1V8SIF0_9PEZI|nr:hypothetical protein B0A48_15254 [Cryoendolithus antarcticus]
MIVEAERDNFEVFRDCLSTPLIDRLAPRPATRRRLKGRENEIKPVVLDTGDDTSAAELSDFIKYIAEEIFTNLPTELRSLSYAAIQNDVPLVDRYATPLVGAQLDAVLEPLPNSVVESLTSYSLLADPSDLPNFLSPVLSIYIATTISPPPEYTPSLTASRPSGCEICAREQLPLTYHHLIPREIHAKAVKRGWHAEWELNKVAWLCRQCHSFCHKIATNEELAKELFSIELLLEREDVRKWAMWVGRVRWKAR